MLVEESVPLVAISHDGNGGGVGNKGDETTLKKLSEASRQTNTRLERKFELGILDCYRNDDKQAFLIIILDHPHT